MSRISSGMATSGSSLTSWRISSIGKSGARSSGPTGWPVPGGSTGCGGGRPAGEVRKGAHKRAARAAVAVVRMDAELVEEHLRALVGVRQLDAAHEADRLLVAVGDEQ